MYDLDYGNLHISIENTKEIRLVWSGRSENRNPAELLNPYLTSVFELYHNKEVILDFISLEYMNSSTIPPILHLLKKRGSEKISTLILYNKLSKWQCASFSALSSAVLNINNIIIEGRQPPQ